MVSPLGNKWLIKKFYLFVFIPYFHSNLFLFFSSEKGLSYGLMMCHWSKILQLGNMEIECDCCVSNFQILELEVCFIMPSSSISIILSMKWPEKYTWMVKCKFTDHLWLLKLIYSAIIIANYKFKTSLLHDVMEEDANLTAKLILILCHSLVNLGGGKGTKERHAGPPQLNAENGLVVWLYFSNSNTNSGYKRNLLTWMPLVSLRI